MKKIILFSVVALAVTAGGAFAQMGTGQHMMGTAQQPQIVTPSQQEAQPYTGMMGSYGAGQPIPGYGAGQMYPGMMGGYGTFPGMMGGYGAGQPMPGYGAGQMYPGMMGGYGMQQPMMGYGPGQMYPGMMGGYAMQQPMVGGYGMGHMSPGMMGYGTPPCMSGYGMQQPMTGQGMGYGMHPGMMSGGMPHMYPGAGGDVDKQREFMKETSQLRKKLHDLMFDYMEAQWNPDTKPEQLEKLGGEMQELQQGIYEKSREALK